MAHETQLRFQIDDLEKLRAKLREIGATEVETYEETDYYFDNEQREYNPGNEAQLLRIRVKRGKTYLTHKAFSNLTGFKEATVTTIEISSLEDMKIILEHLGLHVDSAFTKKKTVWKLPYCLVEIHAFIFGMWVELKGSRDTILRRAGDLGFSRFAVDTVCYSDRAKSYALEKAVKIGEVI